MTPNEAKDSYRRLMELAGETITLRRYTGTGTDRTSADYDDIRARVTGYDPSELVGDIQQGDSKCIVLADDVAASGITLPLTKADKIVIRGKELAIQAIDDKTRRIQGVLIAYEIGARG